MACMSPGAGAHRDIERGKVPSAARVAYIARSACTSLDQNSNKQNFSEQSGTMGKIPGYIYTSIYYCCKSFPVLLHDVMGGWIVPDVFISVFWFRCCCCRCVLLLLPTTSVLKRREVPATVSSFSVFATTTAISFASISLLLLL